jgi:hypothetical protein
LKITVSEEFRWCLAGKSLFSIQALHANAKIGADTVECPSKPIDRDRKIRSNWRLPGVVVPLPWQAD